MERAGEKHPTRSFSRKQNIAFVPLFDRRIVFFRKFAPMKFAASQICEILQGTIEGDAAVTVDRLAKIEEADEGSITFLANPKYTPYIYTTHASVVIVSRDFTPSEAIRSTLIRVENPYTAFTVLLEFTKTTSNPSKRGSSSPLSRANTPK